MEKIDGAKSMAIAMTYKRLAFGENMPEAELAKRILDDAKLDGAELDAAGVHVGLSLPYPTDAREVFDEMTQPGRLVNCAIFEDSHGIRETLAFFNYLAVENFINRYKKVFRFVADLGQGKVMPAVRGQVAPIALDTGCQAIVSPINSRVLNGEVDSFAYEHEEWKLIPGAITSFIGKLADPIMGKPLIDAYEGDENAPNAYATEEQSKQAFENYRPLYTLFKAMEQPEITIITKKAAELIDNCKLTASVEDLKLSEPLILKGQDFLTDGILEMALMVDEEKGTFLLAHEQLFHGHRSTIVTRFDGEDIKSDFSKIEDEEKGKDTPLAGSREITSKAYEFAVKYLLLRRAEKTPIQSIETDKRGNKMKKGLHAIPRYSSVSLTREYRARKEAYDKSHPVPLDKEGKHLTTVRVSGFIRQQVCGKGRSERKTIWVEAFDRGQWVRDGIRIIRVTE